MMDARSPVVPADPTGSALLTDLYQLTMLQAYLAQGCLETAVFEFFVRRLPPSRGFLLAAGLEQAIGFLETLHVSDAELDWLARCHRFDRRTLDWLAQLRFTGDVDAMPEGTAFFGDEPILRVTAPLPMAQLVESRLMNILHFQSLIASKAARMVLAAPGKLLVDFGLRRAHGAEAGLFAARASYIAGFSGTATTLAGMRWGIPLYGTMAHAFVQAFDSETAAFEAFARARPEGLTLLIDTYDTEAAARKVVALAPRLRQAGIAISGVRLDSGDLVALSRSVRRILDEGGLADVTIFASGGLDEEDLTAFAKAGAPIDGYGLGTSLTTSSDAPALDCAYKLQEYAGVARRKLSAGKATWPGRKQVWRRYGPDGRMQGDLLSLETEPPADGEPLLAPALRGGRRVGERPSLGQIRERAEQNLSQLPQPLQQLASYAYPVEVGAALRALANAVDARIGESLGR
jgi:nicotinate phosphoribosyltransferase